VQILKRAVKVKKNGEEEELERLVRKWTEAGREVAYELWELVKYNGSEERSMKLEGKRKRGFEESWGWNDKRESKENSWGWYESPNMEDGGEGRDKGLCHAEEEEERAADTLGTMLRQLGIAPETLGWDDEEGMFIDK
jgi:hypothetical protein